MEFLIDVLDERLEAIAAVDDRERLRRYLGLWRDGAIDPLRDPGVVVIAALDAELGARGTPLCVVANDGEGGCEEARAPAATRLADLGWNACSAPVDGEAAVPSGRGRPRLSRGRCRATRSAAPTPRAPAR